MDETLKKLVVKLMREKADAIEVGNCALTSDEAMSIMSAISHEAMSKEQACRYLNMSRSKFDDKVARKELPKGRKRVGHKELDWWKDELDTWTGRFKRLLKKQS